MSIRITAYPADHQSSSYSACFTEAEASKAREFHRSLAEYAPTSLKTLKSLAKELGIAGLYVKDESSRFGLNAFKGLGGSYALARVLAEKTGKDMREPCTFVTATDGNHGRGIAWAASRLGQKAVVYMPKGSARERLEQIRRLGAEVTETEWNYDDTVRYARAQAEKNGWLLVQDTAWEGYETIPLWIMQGYLTMGLETAEQLQGATPTHIFLQAGVGAMAGSMAGFFENYYGARGVQRPRVVLVEPEKADCLFQTAAADDGRLHRAQGTLDSIMAGLCCGEVCTIGWEILRHQGDFFASCPDYVAADGMRVLGNPLPGDERIISGESGAASVGFLYHLLKKEDGELRRRLGLDEHSVVLCFSTEGDTDRENYRRIVWDGWYRKE